MSYRGDIALGATLNAKFTTVQATGAPTTLAGSPVISAYPDNSTTELTAGITLTVDFDSRTGLNNVAVAATGANGYLAGSNYDLIVTVGTVNSVSAVGYPAGEFSIQARPPQAAAVGATPALGITDAGVMQAGSAGGGTLAATAPSVDLTGQTVRTIAGTGAGQSRLIDTYNTSTKVFACAAWGTAPDTTTAYEVSATPPSSIANPPLVVLVGSAGIKRNTALPGFMFLMTDAILHTPKTGLTVTAQRSLAHAAFANCANGVTELSNGWYWIDLAATDLNAVTVALKFTATGADATNISLVTTP